DEAALLMWDCDCGAVPVIAGDSVGQPVGVITDRDICMCALFQGKPLRDLRVDQAMSRGILTCRSEDSIAQAEQAMREARIRRLPVVDSEGSLVGMLSLADIAREAAREQASSSKDITDTEVNLTIAAICQPSASGAHA